MQPHSSQGLSIVIPTRDRPAELRLCLQALEKSAVPNMECIVVDDGSSAPLADLQRLVLFPLRVIRIARSSGSATARNIGARAARGSILLFLDDDVCVRPGALAGVVAAFARDPGLGALMGRYDDTPQHPEALSQFRNLLHAYTHRISAGPASTFWTGFGAVRTGIFQHHGGFTQEARSIDDVEFGSRLAHAGVRIELRPELQVTHLKRWTMRSMLKTDLLLRGVPWTMLLWRNRKLPNTLNLRHGNRASVALAALAVLLVLVALAGHVHWFVPVVCIAIVLLLNAQFYRFLHGRGGNRFALRSVTLHWLYLWTAALSFTVGTTIFFTHLLRRRCLGRNRKPAPTPASLASSEDAQPLLPTTP